MKLKNKIETTFDISLKVIQRVKEEGLLYVANDMTYKLLLSAFPLLIFVLALMGFFTIDYHILAANLGGFVPDQVLGMVEMIAIEVINVRRPNLLSLSLVVAVFSATSGMRRLVAGIKKAYGEEENRGFLKVYAHSLVLVLIFTLAVMLSTVGIIFGAHIIEAIDQVIPMGIWMVWLYNVLAILISVVVMLGSVVSINKIALDKKVKTSYVLPGAVFTVVIWGIASLGFNLYVHFFSDMAKVYGSVAGFAVFMIWINIVCHVMLVGAVVNREMKATGSS